MNDEAERWRQSLMLLQSNIKGYEQACAAAVAREQALAHEIERIARSFVPQELDQRQGQRGGQKLDPIAMADLVLTAGLPRLWTLEAQATGRAEQHAGEIQRQLTLAEGQIRELQRQLNEAEEAKASLREAAASAQQKIADLQRRLDRAEAAQQRTAERLAQAEATSQASPGPAPAAREAAPEPADAASSPAVTEPAAADPPAGTDPQADEDLGRVRSLVRILAERGHARWALTAQALADELGVRAGGGVLNQLLKQAADLGLVDVQKARNEAGRGGPVNLVRLAEAGRQQAREWFGREPVEQELDLLLARHKSVEHVLLNLQAADVFQQAGLQVDLFPDSCVVDGSTFAPDLLVVDPATGETLYVECERDTPKNPVDRSRKWQLVAAGAGGQINLVTPNGGAMNVLISEVSGWARRDGHQVLLRAGNLADMRPDHLWKVERTVGRRQAASN
jgi:hypothetical protein